MAPTFSIKFPLEISMDLTVWISSLGAYFAFRAWREAMVEKIIDLERRLWTYYGLYNPLDLRAYHYHGVVRLYPHAITIEEDRSTRYKVLRAIFGIHPRGTTIFKGQIQKHTTIDKKTPDILVKALKDTKSNRVEVLEWSKRKKARIIVTLKINATEPEDVESILDRFVEDLHNKVEQLSKK